MAGTLWQKLSLFIVSTLALATASRIQCPSNCQCLSSGTVTCHLHTAMDYKAFAKLSETTKTLSLVVKGSFREDLAYLNKLGVLENLKLMAARQYLSYEEAVLDDALCTFRHKGLFQNLTNLRLLTISLVLKSFNSALLTPLLQLKALSFSHTYMYDFNDFIDIAKVTGTHLLRVKEFWMIAIQRIITLDTIMKMKEHIFENLQNLTLKVLDLSNNKAVVLHQGLPAYLPYLEVFRVGALKLMIFEDDASATACSIAEMIMHANIREFELSFPEKTALESTESEDYINLVNMVNTVNVRTGDVLHYCMQHINISGNMCDLVTCICKGLKKPPCQPYAKQIFIADLILPPKPGQPWGLYIPVPPSLQTFVYRNYPTYIVGYTINISFNPRNWSNIVRYADISSNYLQLEFSPKFSMTGLPQLRFFNLQGNKIVLSDEITMLDLPSLEVLLLGNNNISILSKSGTDFSHLQNLKVLDLENCGIQQMPVNSLQLLRKLEILNLSGNILTEFEVNITSLGHLKLLNLSTNDISTLGEGLRYQLDMLAVTVDISGNPLSCFCNNIDFVQWLQTTPVQFAGKDATKCSHPTLQSVSPWKVDLNALHRACIQFDAIISSVCSAVGMALVVTAIFVLYRRRWTIRYWLYATKESWRRRQQRGEGTPLLTQGYIYDAFIAYSSHGQERSWVHTTLRDKLENEHGLKLCMYHRDFKVGRDLAETIVEGINSSNKTLLILTPNFLNSGWCEFEVRMANEKVISERRDSLVIVIFKRLDEAGTRLPKTLARLMEKKIYIEWTDDPDGQRLFWRRLVDSIRSDTSYDAFNVN